MSLSDEMRARLQKDVTENNVVLYMKGSQDFPQCGFSARAAQVLKAAKVKFADFDILGDNDLRLGLKAFSEWPTFPQCYIKGQFVGGSDILLEMYENGELQEMVKDFQEA